MLGGVMMNRSALRMGICGQRRRNLLKHFLLACFLLLLIVLYSSIICFKHSGVPPQLWQNTTQDPRFVKVFPAEIGSLKGSSPLDRRLILLWTPFFTSAVWDVTHNVFQDCPVSRCEVTTNRRMLNFSQALLFNVREISYNPRDPLPRWRSPEQVWILHNTEPPYYIYLDLNKYNTVFNWTSWFRQDATIYSPYGNWESKSSKEKHNFKPENYFYRKTKMAVWVSSNCNDKAKRIKVVKELQKYISIDTFGKCGDFNCKKQCKDIFADYKFYLSFENGYCRDYVTEKFWNPISWNQIPVVRGGADYRTLVPPGSYINIDDFPTIESLAEHLLNVANNEHLYNSYFAWKENYKITSRGWTMMNWCKLCESLHDNKRRRQVYTDLKGWVQQDTCTGSEYFWC